MTKEEKALVIENIAAQLGEYPHFIWFLLI